MTDADGNSLARIEVSLAHLTSELLEMKGDVKDIDSRLRDVEKTLAGRVKPAALAAGVSATVALLMFAVYVLDRLYAGGTP